MLYTYLLAIFHTRTMSELLQGRGWIRLVFSVKRSIASPEANHGISDYLDPGGRAAVVEHKLRLGKDPEPETCDLS